MYETNWHLSSKLLSGTDPLKIEDVFIRHSTNHRMTNLVFSNNMLSRFEEYVSKKIMDPSTLKMYMIITNS